VAELLCDFDDRQATLVDQERCEGMAEVVGADLICCPFCLTDDFLGRVRFPRNEGAPGSNPGVGFCFVAEQDRPYPTLCR
jgi:hypothetical protein